VYVLSIWFSRDDDDDDELSWLKCRLIECCPGAAICFTKVECPRVGLSG